MKNLGLTEFLLILDLAVSIVGLPMPHRAETSPVPHAQVPGGNIREYA